MHETSFQWVISGLPALKDGIIRFRQRLWDDGKTATEASCFCHIPMAVVSTHRDGFLP